jgi:hypothetical protein
MKKIFALLIPFLLPVCMYAQEKNPLPTIPKPRPVDSETVGDWKTFPEMKLNLPIAKGPFEPTWESIEKNYPGTPQWLRDAKFGIWVHFGHNQQAKVATGMPVICINQTKSLCQSFKKVRTSIRSWL